jgi:CBS domain-containing protein
MPLWLWGIVAVYFLGRSAGKIVGAWLGASLTRSEPVVRRYLGMGLIAQGGVAVGLSITASNHLAGIVISENLSLGDAIIYGVTATTLIAQIAGPALVKLAVKLAGESGRNVTAEDIIDTLSVADVMDKKILHITENMSLTDAVRTFTENEPLFYPVIDKNGKLIGTLSLAGMKTLLADQESWSWLIVSDVLETIEEKTTPEIPLREILTRMRKLKIEQIPVVDSENSNKPVGMIDMSNVNRRIEKKLISVRQTGK